MRGADNTVHFPPAVIATCRNTRRLFTSQTSTGAVSAHWREQRGTDGARMTILIKIFDMARIAQSTLIRAHAELYADRLARTFSRVD